VTFAWPFTVSTLTPPPELVELLELEECDELDVLVTVFDSFVTTEFCAARLPTPRRTRPKLSIDEVVFIGCVGVWIARPAKRSKKIINTWRASVVE